MKIISWYIRQRADLWPSVAALDADVALLQEASEPAADMHGRLGLDSTPWVTDGPGKRPWRASVVSIKPHLAVERIPTVRLHEADLGRLGVSRLGTIAAARVPDTATGEQITVVSMYAVWESPLNTGADSWIFADASAHRLVSDLSALLARQKGHRIIAAGDLNSLLGHGEHGSKYWAGRYATIFSRFAAIGLDFVGPQFPNGRQATPWPAELPTGSLNVPTYHTSHQTPDTATRQLDFVFASRDLVPRLSVRALNDSADWGGSDHCRVEIVVRDA